MDTLVDWLIGCSIFFNGVKAGQNSPAWWRRERDYGGVMFMAISVRQTHKAAVTDAHFCRSTDLQSHL